MFEDAKAHAIVKVKYEDDEPARWQCFTHGPECWTTAALRDKAKASFVDVANVLRDKGE